MSLVELAQQSAEHKLATVFTRFERVHFTYKSLSGVDFEAAVLVPKPLAASTTKTHVPFLTHFHGGGLTQGTILEPCFIPVWTLELAEAENAIIVSPAYRLLPEANGADILDDLKDYWAWANRTLPSLISSKWPHLTVDLDKTAVFGESAGGYLSLLSAFLYPEAKIKAVMAQYPAIFPDVPEYQSAVAEDPSQANAYINNILADIKPGAIRVSSPFPEFLEFSVACGQAGRFRELLGADERLRLDYGLRTNKSLPAIWVLQGADDSIVPKAASDTMVTRIRQAHPDAPVLYSTSPGDHGFDGIYGLTEPCIAEGLKFIRGHWP